MGWEKNPREKEAHEWGIDCKVPEGNGLKEQEVGDVWRCDKCGARHQVTDISTVKDDESGKDVVRAGWLRLPRE